MAKAEINPGHEEECEDCPLNKRGFCIYEQKLNTIRTAKRLLAGDGLAPAGREMLINAEPEDQEEVNKVIPDVPENCPLR